MAKINFNELLSSEKANSVYLLKSEDDTIVSILSLENGVDVNKYVSNVQEYFSEIADTIGIVGEGDVNAKLYASLNFIVNGDSRKVAIEKLDGQSKINADNIASNLVLINTNITDIQAILDSIGQANGIAPLDADAKIDSIYLPDVLLQYKGTWDADTNTPALTDATGSLNEWYRVNVAGTSDLGSGPIPFEVNDKVVHNGTIWEKWDTVESVLSVNGKKGAVVLDKTDIGLSNVTDDAQLKREAGDILSFSLKTTPEENDVLIIEDSSDSYSKKRILLAEVLGSGGGGGGSFAWGLNENISPLESTEGGMETLDFDFESEMAISALVVVPESYTPGDQITLENALFFSPDTQDNVYFRTLTTLFKVGEDITSPVNNRISTNSEITLTTANAIEAVGSLDLTDGVGEISSVAVGVGDILKVKFFRDNTSETTSSTEDARFLKYSSSVKFKQ